MRLHASHLGSFILSSIFLRSALLSSVTVRSSTDTEPGVEVMLLGVGGRFSSERDFEVFLLLDLCNWNTGRYTFSIIRINMSWNISKLDDSVTNVFWHADQQITIKFHMYTKNCCRWDSLESTIIYMKVWTENKAAAFLQSLAETSSWSDNL